MSNGFSAHILVVIRWFFYNYFQRTFSFFPFSFLFSKMKTSSAVLYSLLYIAIQPLHKIWSLSSKIPYTNRIQNYIYVYISEIQSERHVLAHIPKSRIIVDLRNVKDLVQSTCQNKPTGMLNNGQHNR